MKSEKNTWSAGIKKKLKNTWNNMGKKKVKKHTPCKSIVGSM
jgi:hypothetical protein